MKTDKELWLSIMLILATAVLMAATYFRWVNFGFSIGPYRFSHWVVWIGSLYVAFAVLLFSAFKRRAPVKMKALLRIHVYGNLLAFLLISIHFASQIARPAEFFPDLGTGLALYVVMLLLTTTGFLQRFRIMPGLKLQSNRFFHVSVAVSFYILIGIHILHGVGII
jgi:hypothetical protein